VNFPNAASLYSQRENYPDAAPLRREVSVAFGDIRRAEDRNPR